MDLNIKIKEAADFILSKTKYKPNIGLILGSGLGSLGDYIEDAEYYNYDEIPHFPTSTVQGHAGKLIIGKLQGKTIVSMQGRFHYYEGYTMQQVTFPIRVMKLLGIQKLLVTNAAGAVNTSYDAGDLMLISDHINLCGTNPLIGKNLEDFGPRFPDMSEPYNKDLRNKAKAAASALNLTLREGVYAMMSGPSYETPAEIKMIRTLGGDAVGMSTIPEVIIANHQGMQVLGISCISNMAAGILHTPLSHKEVIETSEKVKNNFISLMKSIITLL
ncbi:MAG: purine-nucleoside phosphorylase [Clostridiaceae bacterium]